MTYIDLYTSALDWLTLTSFETEFYKYWEKRLKSHGELKEKMIPRYQGWAIDLDRGTGTVYTGMQNGTEHYMLHLTGPAAEDEKDPAFSFVRQRIATCKRIDLQVTVPMPQTWRQFDLLVRLEGRGLTPEYRQSKDKNGCYQTVYVGARTSDRFTRVYVKPSSETMLLRLETEYKDDRARSMAKRLADGDATPSRYLLHELQKTMADDALSLLFEPSLSGAIPLTEKLKVLSTADKTEKWLTQQVYPAFQRHINDHNASGRALAAFYAACKEAMKIDEESN